MIDRKFDQLKKHVPLFYNSRPMVVTVILDMMIPTLKKKRKNSLKPF
jgi:mannose/fructose/N-acetylgalactosamine-specific phosphotransferase system component IID